MAAKGTQYQLPLVAKLVKNREDQQAADAQKNFEERDGGLQFFRGNQPDGVEFGTVMEWVGVFFRVFWLSVFSGSFLFIWVFVLKMAGF
jgi:hypothetical protein